MEVRSTRRKQLLGAEKQYTTVIEVIRVVELEGDVRASGKAGKGPVLKGLGEQAQIMQLNENDVW